MKFKYKELPHGLKRPIIRIVLSHNGREVPYYGLIDSGADINLVHADLAPLLGIELEDGKRHIAGGIVEGERRPYYVHTVTVHVGGSKHEDVPVAFMPSLAKTGHGLLGQYGFF